MTQTLTEQVRETLALAAAHGRALRLGLEDGTEVSGVPQPVPNRPRWWLLADHETGIPRTFHIASVTGIYHL